MTHSDLSAIFAPTGKLRVSINVGNPILAHRNNDGEPGGVSVDMARELALVLGVDVEFIVFESASRSVECVSSEHADIGFFAIDPRRATALHFTAPYILIEGAYLVRNTSPITNNDDVDCTGTRIVVGKGSAYDLYLSRQLTAAELIRAPTSPAVVGMFMDQGLDVAAGVKQQLEADARRYSDLRILPGRFMVIQQAMGMPRSRPKKAATFLATFVEQQKANGFVAQAMKRHNIQGAAVAPKVDY